jgi:hypothetical protein
LESTALAAAFVSFLAGIEHGLYAHGGLGAHSSFAGAAKQWLVYAAAFFFFFYCSVVAWLDGRLVSDSWW